MFPRVPRLLRLALFVVLLALSLLLVLRAGGGQHAPNAQRHLLRLHRPPSPSDLHRLTDVRKAQTTPPKVARALRANGTLAAVTAGSSAEGRMTTAAQEAFVNPHPFSYLINPVNACRTAEGSHAKVLVYVHSAPANFKKRMSIRQTWGERDVLESYGASLVFIMGMVPEATLMDLVRLESERYGDVVQEDFLDSYRNLTYKAIAGLKWAAKFCPRVTYILKTDDDILVNLPRLMEHVQRVVEPQYGRQRLILCNQWVRMKIIRDTKSKWYIPEKDLKGDFFPPYCSGSAFLLSGDMAGLLFRASLTTPFFWVDDFYITGTLVERLEVKHRSLNKAYSLNPGVAEGKFRNDTRRELIFFHLHKLRVMYNMWANMSAAATTPASRSTATAPAQNVSRPSSVLSVARAA